MNAPALGRRLGLAVLALTMVAAALTLVAVSLSGVTSRTDDGASLDALIGRLAGVAAGLGLAWLALAVAACVLTTVWRPPGRAGATADRLASTLPRPLRAVVAAALGVAVLSGTALPAATALSVAAPSMTVSADLDPAWPASAQATAVDDGARPDPGLPDPALPDPALPDPALPAPGWAPERPAAAHQAAAAGLLVEQPRPALVGSGEVVVRRGDTLWDIAARHLPTGATDVEIATEWPRWYEANRDLVGPDPDHIEPGQRLRPPITVPPTTVPPTTGTTR